MYKIVKFDHHIYFFVSSFFLFYINLFIVAKVSAWCPRKCRKAISVVLFFFSFLFEKLDVHTLYRGFMI